MNIKAHSAFLLVACVLSCEPCGAGEISATTKSSVVTSSTANYQRIAAQLNELRIRAAVPKDIEAALEGALSQAASLGTNPANQPQSRADLARVIITNLCLLETNLRQTSVVTNTQVKPPEHLSLPLGAPIETLKDPLEREQMLAYNAARKASGQLWNLHQEFQAGYNRRWDQAMGWLAGAYAHQPTTDTELQSLLKKYAGHDCILQLSNRLYGAQN